MQNTVQMCPTIRKHLSHWRIAGSVFAGAIGFGSRQIYQTCKTVHTHKQTQALHVHPVGLSFWKDPSEMAIV